MIHNNSRHITVRLVLRSFNWRGYRGYMNKFPILACLSLACLVWVCGCSVVSPAAPTLAPSQPAIQPTLPLTHPDFTALIGEIRESPGDFEGKTVEIVGYFHGWDLLGEAGIPPPVTRSDWVIKDNSGAIYVTGMLPEGLDPAAKEQTSTVVRLAARVAKKGDAVYLEAQSVQVQPDP